MQTKEKLPKDLVRIALLLVLGSITPLLDATMVNIALNDLAESFHVSLGTIQWVTSGYILAMAVAVPFTSYFVKKYDGKKIFIIIELIFLVCSLGAGLSQNIGMLIVFRIFQGMSAGMITPLTTTLQVKAAGQANLGRLMAITGTPMILGPIIGPVIGGIIVEYLSWHWIFFINVPIGILVVLTIWKKFPSFPAENEKARMDWIGVSLLAILSASFIYGISEASSRGFMNPITVTFICVGIVLTAVYCMYARQKKRNVIIPLTLFHSKNFSASFSGLFFAGFILNGSMLLFPLFFQNVKEYSTVISALALIAQGLGMLLIRPFIGKITDEKGSKYVVIFSCLLSFLATVPFAFFAKDTNYIWIGLILLIRGMGIGGITLPLMTDSYTGLPQEQVAETSTATRIAQNTGGAFGAATIATIVAAKLGSAAPTLGSYTDSYQFGFLMASLLGCILFIPALFLTNKWKRKG